MFAVTWPRQVASGRPPEEYASESRAEGRAQELLATGEKFAVVYAVDEAGMVPRSHKTGPRSAEQGNDGEDAA